MIIKNECDSIKDLLIKKILEERVTDSESRVLEEHLSGCVNCQAYAERINVIAGSQKLQPVDLAPVEKVLRNAMTMSAKETKPVNLPKKSWEFIVDFFQYRIPLYQSAIAVVILFMFFYKIDTMPGEGIEETVQIPDSLESIAIPEKYSYIIDNIDIIESQRIGETVMEDSSVLKFSFMVF